MNIPHSGINYFNKLAFSFFLIVFFVDCGNKKEHQNNNNSGFDITKHNQDSSSTAPVIINIAIDSFDVNQFISLADSLLSSLCGKQIKLIYAMSPNLDNISGPSSYSPCLNLSSASIKSYSFDPGKGSRELRLWIVEAIYPDTAGANEVISNLHNAAAEPQGLTYSNDFVIQNDNKIYWLHSGCSYAFYNHSKLKKYMLLSIPHNNMLDSINCRCGSSEIR